MTKEPMPEARIPIPLLYSVAASVLGDENDPAHANVIAALVRAAIVPAETCTCKICQQVRDIAARFGITAEAER